MGNMEYENIMQNIKYGMLNMKKINKYNIYNFQYS